MGLRHDPVTRSYHLSVTRSARVSETGDPASARSVWYLMHGYGQLAEDFLGQCEALAGSNRLLVAPEGLSRFYTRGLSDRPGASWMTREDRETEIRDQAAYLDAVHESVMDRLASPSRRVIVLGFSQGATTADRWIAGSAIEPDALVLWGGAPAMDLGSGTAIARRYLMVHGVDDPYVTPKAARSIRDLLESRGQVVETITYGGAHAIDPATLAGLAERLDP